MSRCGDPKCNIVNTAARPSKRERTRALLIDAALDVLAERGLEAISIDDFMAVAGMARGTFYNYFQSREDVLVAVARHLEDEVLNHVILRLPTEITDDARVAATIYGIIRFFVDNPRLGWVQVRMSGGTRWFGDGSERREALRAIDRAIAAVADEGVPMLAGIVYLEGAILTSLRRILEGRITLEEADSALLMTLRGLGVSNDRLACVVAEAKHFASRLGE